MQPMTTPRIRQGVIHDLPEAKYHGHLKSIGSTGIKQLLVSPRKFLYEREHPQVRDPLEFGNVVHALALGKGSEYDVLDFDDRRTNAYKDAAKESRDAGVIPILRKEYERAEAMAVRLFEHPVAGPLLLNGESEVSAFAKDPATGVLRKARADKLHADGLIVDLKTTAASAEPVTFAIGRTSASLGYHISTAHYIDTFELAGVQVRGFAHIFVEKDPPHLISVVQLDDEAVQAGRERVALALEIFRDCTASGVWPDWSRHHDQIMSVSLPPYALREVAS